MKRNSPAWGHPVRLTEPNLGCVRCRAEVKSAFKRLEKNDSFFPFSKAGRYGTAGLQPFWSRIGQETRANAGSAVGTGVAAGGGHAAALAVRQCPHLGETGNFSPSTGPCPRRAPQLTFATFSSASPLPAGPGGGRGVGDGPLPRGRAGWEGSAPRGGTCPLPVGLPRNVVLQPAGQRRPPLQPAEEKRER